MSIGTTIKRLRRERRLTQEGLAEHLGISAQAISQWECDKSTPDIAQLPILANLFDVSADVLLEIDITKKKSKIDEIYKTAMDYRNQADRESALRVLREGLKQYPSSHRLMYALADTLVCIYSRTDTKNYSEVIKLCQTILAESTDIELRGEALNTLAVAYDYAGDNENMLRTVAKMTSASSSKESFMLWRNVGDAGMRQNQKYLDFLLAEMCSILSVLPGSSIYTEDERIRLYEQVIAIIDTIFPDGDYALFAHQGSTACASIAKMYFRRGDMNAFYHWLNRHCDFCIYADNYDCGAAHTSPALRNLPLVGWIQEGSMTWCHQSLTGWMSDPKFAKLDDPKFAQAMERLRVGK